MVEDEEWLSYVCGAVRRMFASQKCEVSRSSQPDGGKFAVRCVCRNLAPSVRDTPHVLDLPSQNCARSQAQLDLVSSGSSEPLLSDQISPVSSIGTTIPECTLSHTENGMSPSCCGSGVRKAANLLR